MSKGRVLVIDDDEWVCRLLAVAMREAGFEITITENAADGFYRAVEEQPDCIVCDVDLPDHNGYWVAKKIRSHPSKVAMAPFVFLSGLDDREHRLEGFQVGGDAYLTKPFRIDEVVAQVDALIQMAARLRKARQTLTSMPPPNAAMLGDLSQMSVATLLTLLDLERRSGALDLRSEEKKAQIRIAAGSIVETTMNDAKTPPLDTIRMTTAWVVGKFTFTPSEDRPPTPDAIPINALLMEAARLEDEERASDAGARSISTRVGAWKETVRATQRPFAPSTSQSGSFELGPLTPRPPSEMSAVPAHGGPEPSKEAPAPQPKAEAPMPEPPMPEARQAETPPELPRPDVAKVPLPKPMPAKVEPRPLAAMKPPQPPNAAPKPPDTPKPQLTPPARGPLPPAPGSNRGLAPPVKAPAPPGGPRPPPMRPAFPGRTGFGPQLRSLSPARGIPAVSPPPPAVVTEAKSPAPGAAAPAPAAPANPAPPPPSVAPDSLDEGWSTPPRAPQKDEPPALEEPGRPSKDVK